MSYKPSTNLLECVRNLFPLEICPWDDYFPRMAQTDFYLGRKDKKASKTYFIRKAPFGGSFAILGGLTLFLRALNDFKFNNDVIEALRDMGYKEEFCHFLQNNLKQIQVEVSAIEEGMIFFPNEPAVIVEGDIISVRLAEGVLTKCLNFPTLAMTKWRRVVEAASPSKTYEFSRRRAQNDIIISLYAHLAGIDISSNSEVRRGADIPISGSMGHEWIQSFSNEFDAFDKWLEINPDRPILLIDTISTLKSGVPSAIKAFKKHWTRIKETGGIPGIRNDSGDLAYLTIEESRMLKKAGLNEVMIFETNDLDEYSIQSIKEQIFTQTPKSMSADFVLRKVIWACGTNPGTCSDQPSIGGVVKLTSIENDQNEEKAVIKIAHDNPIKTSIPGSNRSAHVYTEDGELLCCLIYHKDEQVEKTEIAYHPDDKNKKIRLMNYKNLSFKKRQTSTFFSREDFDSVRNRVKEEMENLHWTHKRFNKPHKVKVSVTGKIFNLRENMIRSNQLMEN